MTSSSSADRSADDLDVNSDSNFTQVSAHYFFLSTMHMRIP